MSAYVNFKDESPPQANPLQNSISRTILTTSNTSSRTRSRSLSAISRRNSIFDGDQDDKSEADKMRDAIDAWSSYCSYRTADLPPFLVSLMVVLGYEWGHVDEGTSSMLSLFLMCELGFHGIRMLCAFGLFVRSHHRVKDFEATTNKHFRRKCHRLLVSLHFLFLLIFGSYSVHQSHPRFNSLYNCSLFVVIYGVLLELYSLVDPFFNENVVLMWEGKSTYSTIVRNETLSNSQLATLYAKLSAACDFYRVKPKRKCNRLPFRRITFVALACLEFSMVLLFWNKGLCFERDRYLECWLVVDIVLHIVFGFLPLPKSPALVQGKDNEESLQSNPMVGFHRAVAMHVVHFSWAFWGSILLSWSSSCLATDVLNCLVATVAVVMAFELRCLIVRWLEYDHAVTLYYVWVLGSPSDSAALVHWAMQPRVSTASQNTFGFRSEMSAVSFDPLLQ